MLYIFQLLNYQIYNAFNDYMILSLKVLYYDIIFVQTNQDFFSCVKRLNQNSTHLTMGSDLV